MEEKTQEFLEIFDAYIKRDGAQELKNYLLKSDFFKAPASSRYHCAFEGGLCEHSVNTYKRLLKNVQNEYGENWETTVSHETVAICGLLHDLCKIDFYKVDYRNAKENGEWVKKPYYAREEALLLLLSPHIELQNIVTDHAAKLAAQSALRLYALKRNAAFHLRSPPFPAA